MCVSLFHFRTWTAVLLILGLTGLLGCASGLKMPITEPDRQYAAKVPVIHVVRHVNQTQMTTSSSAAANSQVLMYRERYGRDGSADLASVLRNKQEWPEISQLIGQHLMSGLQKSANLKNLQAAEIPPDAWMASFYHGPGDTMAAYQKAFGPSLVLDIRSVVASHFTVMNWKTHTFGITAKAVLVRPSDGKIFWRGFCVIDEQDGKKFTHRPFDTSDAEGKRVHDFLYAAGKQCAQDLVAQYLGAQ